MLLFQTPKFLWTILLLEGGGAALIIPNSFPILDHGVSGTGNAVWALIDTPIGPVKTISIHAPNTVEERTLLWERLDDIIGDQHWIMARDHNMVELQEDSRGKTALMAGAEARAWKQLTLRKGLIDAYLCATKMSGGVFTCQAFCGLRLDRARLDRFYISEGAVERKQARVFAGRAEPSGCCLVQSRWNYSQMVQIQAENFTYKESMVRDLQNEPMNRTSKNPEQKIQQGQNGVFARQIYRFSELKRMPDAADKRF
ncbi:hypothetical protein R1sor_014795 [Riccia sorocarpa]|uniref:Uncharacterized protein n=1 Tax=Riccia sorocarpa TaxID=122646 RepID=A0ABD3HC96_9MARC